MCGLMVPGSSCHTSHTGWPSSAKPTYKLQLVEAGFNVFDEEPACIQDHWMQEGPRSSHIGLMLRGGLLNLSTEHCIVEVQLGDVGESRTGFTNR